MSQSTAQVTFPYTPGMPTGAEEKGFIANRFGRAFMAHAHPLLGDGSRFQQYEGQDMPDLRPVEEVPNEISSPVSFADHIENTILGVPFDPSHQDKYEWQPFDDDKANKVNVERFDISSANASHLLAQRLADREKQFIGDIAYRRAQQWSSISSDLAAEIAERFGGDPAIEEWHLKYLWHNAVTRDARGSIEQYNDQSQMFRSWVGIRGIGRNNSSLHWVAGNPETETPTYAGHIAEPHVGIEWGYQGVGSETAGDLILLSYASYAQAFGRSINPYTYRGDFAGYVTTNLYSHDAPIERATEFHLHYLEIQDFVIDASIQMVLDVTFGTRMEESSPLAQARDAVAKHLKKIVLDTPTGFLEPHRAIEEIRTYGTYEGITTRNAPETDQLFSFVRELDTALQPVAQLAIGR